MKLRGKPLKNYKELALEDENEASDPDDLSEQSPLSSSSDDEEAEDRSNSTSCKEKYFCSHCSSSFNNREKLTNHLKIVDCEKCSLSFECKGQLNQHLNKEENKICAKEYGKSISHPHQCENCNQKLKDAGQLAEHLENKSCEECGNTYSCFITYLKRHQRSKLKCGATNASHPVRTVKKNITCTECGKKFNGEFNLKVHQSKSGCANNKVKTKFKCKFCNFPLSNADKLRRHQKNQKCPKCKTFLGCWRAVSGHLLKCNPKSSQDVPPRPNPPCYICGEKFRSLSWHQNTKHLCKKCGKQFACYGLLRRHKKTCQGDKKCPRCESFLSVARSLYSHIQPRKCTFCAWTAPCFYLFRNHSCAKKKKNKRCPFCGISCDSADLLRTHARPVRCPRCAFVQPCDGILEHHLQKCRFTSVSECPICCKMFGSVVQYAKHAEEEHLRANEDRRQSQLLICHLCEKGFKRKNKLRFHVKIAHLDAEQKKNKQEKVVSEEETNDLLQNKNNAYGAIDESGGGSIKNSALKEEPVSNDEMDIEILNHICTTVNLKAEEYDG